MAMYKVTTIFNKTVNDFVGLISCARKAYGFTISVPHRYSTDIKLTVDHDQDLPRGAHHTGDYLNIDALAVEGKHTLNLKGGVVELVMTDSEESWDDFLDAKFTFENPEDYIVASLIVPAKTINAEVFDEIIARNVKQELYYKAFEISPELQRSLLVAEFELHREYLLGLLEYKGLRGLGDVSFDSIDNLFGHFITATTTTNAKGESIVPTGFLADGTIL